MSDIIGITEKPLESIKVLSVEQFGAGPYGTMFLADLGAEVIKIENVHIGGDPGRYTGPYLLGNADSEYFQSWNMNKKSITLDLKNSHDYARFLDLAKDADAVVNNLRGDQPEKLSLTFPALKATNPRIACLHISAYGRDNRRAAWPGYDFLMQAEAGLMSVTGEPAGPPTKFGPSIIDYMTGMTGMFGLLACILRAKQTGLGGDVDVSLFDVALHQLSYAGTWYLNHGHVTNRQSRSAHFSVAPVQTFQTSDGWIFVMCMTDKFWQNLIGAMDLCELGSDPRFATAPKRRENLSQLVEILDERFSQKSTLDWLDALSGLLPVAPVYDMRQAFENPFVDEVGMVQTIPHAASGSLRVLSNPIKIDGKRPAARAAPLLGANNDELLQHVLGGQSESQP
ncbi:CoA transferase [Mesorhizobium sp.]|uniref:CaiB/BaiF CoA transferase family protein n=1 Tax=Mesorhizobium sp. TaxID=1871066 RepID=UPI000FE4BD60|nr:CoA transferase [Mesorhizobium sp.]RWG01519.1 MAG: CoA transferase [Mesorhizobium sp.]RWG97634.1 MAG: CoA transferase [Mesorhizobium sp.]TIN48692.1 MAG: CoA transferase [Mesorhizobium sp.]TIR92571.1 MAG: CoA transferase [Mesorhizobium sp.]TIS04567.1 MAG: CoA transferase [Mesorhizobium sp.]